MTHPLSHVRRLPRLVALLTVVWVILWMAAVTLAQRRQALGGEVP